MLADPSHVRVRYIAPPESYRSIVTPVQCVRIAPSMKRLALVLIRMAMYAPPAVASALTSNHKLPVARAPVRTDDADADGTFPRFGTQVSGPVRAHLGVLGLTHAEPPAVKLPSRHAASATFRYEMANACNGHGDESKSLELWERLSAIDRAQMGVRHAPGTTRHLNSDVMQVSDNKDETQEGFPRVLLSFSDSGCTQKRQSTQ